MRFSLFSIAAVALSGTALGAATPKDSRSLVTDIGGVVQGVTDGLPVEEIEESLAQIPVLGGLLPLLEDTLGVSFAEKLLNISKEGAEPGLLQSVGEAIAKLLEGTGIAEVDKSLDEATGGTLSSLTDALGLDDVEKALGISPAEASETASS